MNQRIAETEKERAALVAAINKHVQTAQEFHEFTMVEKSVKSRYEETMTVALDTFRKRSTGSINSDLKDELLQALIKHQQVLNK